METLFATIKYLLLGFFGLLTALILIAMIFGKRITRKWEYEADFLDADGREFGEFELELSRIHKVEPDFTLKAKLRLKHPALEEHQTVQVYLDDVLMLEKPVTSAGRVWIPREKPLNRVDKVQTGQTVRVVLGSTEIARGEMRPD